MSEDVRADTAGLAAGGCFFCGSSSGMASMNAASERVRSAKAGATGLLWEGAEALAASEAAAALPMGSPVRLGIPRSAGSGRLGRLEPAPGLAMAPLGTAPEASRCVA